MASVRSKQGYLDLHKGRGKWKSYLFRVTGSTYLHYFGSTKLKEPKEQVLLSQLKSIDVSSNPPKGGKFVFEVKAKGIHWVISANTQNEMIQWMETIQPNCTKTKMLHKTYSLPTTHSVTPSPPPPTMVSPPPPTMVSPPPPTMVPTSSTTMIHPSLSPSTDKNNQATIRNGHDFNNYTMMPTRNVTSTITTSTVANLTPSHPANPPPVSPLKTLPPSPAKPHPPRSRRSLKGDVTAVSPNKSLPVTPKSASTMSNFSYSSMDDQDFEDQLMLEDLARTESFAAPYVEPNQLNMPPPSVKQPQPTLKHKQASLPDTSTPAGDYEVMMTSPTRPALKTCHEVPHLDKEVPGNEPTNNSYMMLVKDPQEITNADTHYSIPWKSRSDTCSVKTSTKQQQPQHENGTRKSCEMDTIMGQLSKQFTTDQLHLLVEMIKKTNEKRDLESSMTNEDLGYLVQKTAAKLTDKFLVTLEDDPDSYDKRPSWAKAVNEEDDEGGINVFQFKIETDAYSIPEHEITDMRSIGHGQFGEVFRAEYVPSGDESKRTSVAVKTTRKDCTEKEKKDLLKEMAVMSCLVHPNIVKLYGVVTVGVPAPWIVLEFLPYGDLRKYLQKSEKKPYDTLVKYMVDVALGMHYIAERGLVHRDLAARNVLVGEGELCKVADFGLLRELTEENSTYYSTHNIPCPVRWMPPEAISRKKYSIASDVWSFGILMWEMFNPKKMPYEKMDNIQVAMKVNEGYRLPTPRGCPPVVARLMKACWHTDPLKRPSFILITTLLTSKVSSAPHPTPNDDQYL